MQKLIIQNTKETIYYHVLPQIKKTVFSTGNCLLFIITYICYDNKRPVSRSCQGAFCLDT